MARNNIKRPFRYLSRDAFADMVQQHLELILPNIAQSLRLGDLDRRGIDVLQFEEETSSVTKAIQCKGFERPINSEHIKGLVEEIRKFGRHGPQVDEYWLVINEAIKERSDRKTVQTELDNLVSSGKAKIAKLLDIDPFAQLLEDLAIEKFRLLAERRRQQLKKRYLNSLDNVGYISSVPSTFDGRSMLDPMKGIAKAVDNKITDWNTGHTGPNRRYPRYFVTGSFGFGKTMGLHALGQYWAERGYHSLFIPAVSLHGDFFVNSAGILDFVVLDLFAQEEDFSREHVGYKLVREACKAVLNKEPWMLLIDAIDESEFWVDPTRLKNLWFSIQEMGLPAAVSVRSELIDARPSEFFGEERIKFFKRVDLEDWTPREMDAFIRSFEEVRGTEPPESFNRFATIVRDGRYEEVYGDIPRRPLFLQMLSEDAWDGADPEDKLYRLYGKYLRAKLNRDWWRADSPHQSVRSSTILKRFGVEEAREQIILLMQQLALISSGYEVDQATHSEPVQLKTTQLQITQSQLDQVSQSIMGKVPLVEEVLLNSLIQPAGRDPVRRHRLYKFAHQTFFDWFLARAIVQDDLLVSNISSVTEAFVMDMRDAIQRGEPLP